MPNDAFSLDLPVARSQHLGSRKFVTAFTKPGSRRRVGDYASAASGDLWLNGRDNRGRVSLFKGCRGGDAAPTEKRMVGIVAV